MLTSLRTCDQYKARLTKWLAFSWCFSCSAKSSRHTLKAQTSMLLFKPVISIVEPQFVSIKARATWDAKGTAQPPLGENAGSRICRSSPTSPAFTYNPSPTGHKSSQHKITLLDISQICCKALYTGIIQAPCLHVIQLNWTLLQIQGPVWNSGSKYRAQLQLNIPVSSTTASPNRLKANSQIGCHQPGLPGFESKLTRKFIEVATSDVWRGMPYELGKREDLTTLWI